MDERVGCWFVYYSDYSGMAVFGSEVDALRYAVENSMSIKFVKWGEELHSW